MSVERYMTKPVITINSDTSIQSAVLLMKEHSIRHLPVVRGERFVGLITQSDLRGLIIPSMYGEIDIKDVMVTKPITVCSGDSIDTAATLIYKNKIGALPVVDGNTLVGIITTTDIVAAFIEMMGVLKKSARLDILLKEAPDSFEEVSRIIKENGGEIISVGMLPGINENKVYSFRLKKKNIDPVIELLQKVGHRVISRNA